jgi:TetR/AcrR family transcriptional regulator, regulator of cefoperazone and chloramphenicol sensitivity
MIGGKVNTKGERVAGSDTRRRLRKAAGVVFAEEGFRRATVREICRRAGANVAAVNYHFAGKEGLYRQVLEQGRDAAFQKYPLTLGAEGVRCPEDRLRAFVRTFLFRIFDRGAPSRFFRLMAREFVEPTEVLDKVVTETVRPAFEYLASIVRPLLGPEADEKTVQFHCASIVGQCLYFHVSRHVLSRLFPWGGFNPGDIEAIAEHVNRLSLRAMKAFRKERKEARHGERRAKQD